MSSRERWTGVAAGFVAGLAGGLFGVGGGLVLIPILTSLFHFTQHEAHGTSLAVIGATAVASIVVYGAHSNVAWSTALVVAIASVFTARYGARLAKRTSASGLAQVFAGFLVLVAIRLLWKAPPASGTSLTTVSSASSSTWHSERRSASWPGTWAWAEASSRSRRSRCCAG